MSGATSELAHLFRALKAPAAARAFPGLAERAREESWSYEKFLQDLLSSEVSARDSHGGENRTKSRPVPRQKDTRGVRLHTAAAMIDRLIHHAEILSLKGDSYRLKNHNLTAPPATQPSD